MTDKEEQWLISLSALSLLGPGIDVDAMKENGTFKKNKKKHLKLDEDIDSKEPHYSKHHERVQCFLKVFEVGDKKSFNKALDQFINGSDFGKNMSRLMQLGKALNQVEREKKQSFVINGHPYLFEVFQMIMHYEFHWPKNGCQSYDLANAVMLFRIGCGLGYLDEETRRAYKLKLTNVAKEACTDMKQFGIEAEIGRQVHAKYIKSIGSGKELNAQQDVLSIAYYSIWSTLGLVED